MADIYQIELPSGSTYDLRDSRVDSLNNWSYIVCSSAANTPKDVVWTSGSTTITGTLVASADTMYKIYLVPSANGTNDIYDEYISVNTTGTTYVWEMFGNTKLPDMNDYVKNASGHSGGTAGALAYKGSVSGTVAVPKTYTSTFTGASMTSTGSYTPAGSVSSSFTGTGVRLQTDSKVGTAASFTGSSMTSTGNFTPAGSISVGSGTANYTPAGSIAVSTAGSTTTIKNPTSKTVVTDMSVAAPSSTSASGELVYCSVSGTKLSLQKLVETTGASITTSNVTVKNGDAAYSFTGTGKELKFTGTQGSVSVSGTTAGSVSLTTSNVTVSPASSGTATYTPSGSVSSSFSGTAATLSVSGTTTGSVATSTNTTENKTVTSS